MVLAVAAFIGIGYLVLAQLRAGDYADSSVTVTNSVPVISNLIVGEATSAGLATAFTSNTLNPAEGGTTLYISGTVTDPNGCTDADTIANYTADIWRSPSGTSVSSASPAGVGSGSDDVNFEYSISSGVQVGTASGTTNTCDGPTDTSTTFLMSVSINEAIDPTVALATSYSTDNWKVRVYMTDESGSGTITTNLTTAFEVENLRALESQTASSNFANAPVNTYVGATLSNASDTTLTGVLVTVRNRGNMIEDATMTQLDTDGSALDTAGQVPCLRSSVASGNIALSSFKFYVGGVGAELYSAYTTVSQSVNVDMNLDYNTAATAQDKSIYFKVLLPATGISGTCSVRLNFAAAAAS